jgi:predicted CoA-binding protein
MWTNPDSGELQKILRDTRTVAVVGASSNPARPSHEVLTYLIRCSHFELYPVNPTISAIDDRPVYASLADLPVVPDMVDVFRRTEELPRVLADVLALADRPKVLWLQQGLWDEQVAEQAEAAGIRVVMDRCLKVDYARFGGNSAQPA